MEFYQYFIKLADVVAEKSKDRSTKVGVIVVGPDNEIRSTGYNGFPRGINDDIDERHERPAKYDWTEHAERNAIYNAARMGQSLKGCTMYFNWEPCPCVECARAIIQAGISNVVGYKNRKFAGKGSHWDDNLSLGEQMMLEAGIKVIKLEEN